MTFYAFLYFIYCIEFRHSSKFPRFKVFLNHVILGSASHLTPLQLESLVTEGGTSRFWLVEFRSSLSSSCIRTSRALHELSITVPDQLPTYILFENAEEVSRFPDMHPAAKSSDITKVYRKT
ncbi:hypothetical protein HanXRQr2_Chr16g0759941 [Helianthus annuus]|uniref:Thioredoxin-like fold protein n=1 Tax=Helianthus annuus TaxID=4232 RepID=A0A9K3DVE5_HELAN|nr:hypothetical protein HanXRQr2_Chr16g0759941 [Helianthus annuus]KAJ0645601.1 hypothetical protein HanOQP8_Chr16g0625691 [Helianthus annuus]KAJ0822123.1 hypothetical protein HanPSC8_Chr16g0728231 [Helianthus annuus]